MPFSLTTRRVRCQSDFSQHGAIIDRLTGEEIRIPLASDVRFEIGIFAGLLGNAPSLAGQVASETGWTSLTLTLQKQRGSNVASKTTASFAPLTLTTWNDDTAQHCVVDLTDAETNIPPGKYRLALTVQSSTFGPYPVGTADIHVFDPHNLNSSLPADANPGAPISRDAADLRYAAIGGSGAGVTQIYKMTAAGVVTSFTPSADTDIARGTALLAARTAAVSGDTIFFGPGAYTVTAGLAKAGVNWVGNGVGSITCTDPNVPIWDDGNTAMTFTVFAPGFDFIHACTSKPSDNTQKAIRIRHAATRMTIHCRDITCTNSFVAMNGQPPNISYLYQEAGYIELHGRDFSTRATGPASLPGGYGAWWFNGEGHVFNIRSLSDYVYVASSVSATPTGDFHLTSNYAENSVFIDGTNSVSALWINVNINKEVPFAAHAHATISGNGPANNETVTLNGKTYTFKTSLTPAEGEVLLGADEIAALLNLKNAVNLEGSPGTYSVAAAHPTIIATTSAVLGDPVPQVRVAARTAGVAGNSLTISATGGIAVSGSVLTGGGDVRVGIGSVTGANRAYLTAQKLFGQMLVQNNSIQTFDGLLYIKSDKHAPIANGDYAGNGYVGLLVSYTDGTLCTGTVFYDVTHASPESFTGDMFVWGDATLKIVKTDYTSGASAKGLLVEGGTVKIAAAVRIDTAANSSSNPITMTAGTITVEGRLISQGSRKCIANGDAGTYTVDAWGARANNDPDTGITANGITVDPTVT